MITREFVLAGKALFTIELPAGTDHQPHYTFKVTKKEASGQFPEAYFIALLSGPNNETDYTYVGMLDKKTADVRLTRKSAYPEDSFPVRLVKRILARVWANDHSAYEQHGYRMHHSNKCGKCGKTLTTPESVECGIGPECRKSLLA